MQKIRKKIRKAIMSILPERFQMPVSLLLQKPLEIPLVLMAMPVALFLRLLRPLVEIRFGYLHADRIGHYSINTEFYLCNRDVGKNGRRTIDIFYHRGKICNWQLKKMWERVLPVFYPARWLEIANRLIPGGEKYVDIVQTSTSRDGNNTFVPPHLYFTAEEEEFGRKELLRLGIPQDYPFICFHGRDCAYLTARFIGGNWSYHDFRDANIHNLVPAAEELVRRGYFAVRMGAIVKEKLNVNNQRIIDYAFSRTDFLDIYLIAKCRFFIADTAGIATVGGLFRKPVAWVNFIPLSILHTWGKNDLCIPKKLWLRNERRLLTFREMLNPNIGYFIKTEDYERKGIEPIENTPEEITALAVEMDERLKGTWQESEEEQQLQERFWSIFRTFRPNQLILLRLGAEFLRQNRNLLD